jgi:hypothetical protein
MRSRGMRVWTATTEINVPNFPSSGHAITVQFRDYSQAATGFTEYPRGASAR